MAQLRQTDFLPNRFSGNSIDRDLCTAHYLSFSDYLEAHKLLNENGAASDLTKVVSIFKRSLQGQARLWVEGKTFTSIDDLKQQFINRFSPSKSQFAHVKEFEELSYTQGESAEVHLAKIKKIAQRIHYGETQVRDKFISTLPAKCRAAVIMSVPDNADTPELVLRAQRYLDLETDQGSPKEVTFAATASVEAANSEVHALREELQSLKVDFNNDRASRSREKMPRSSRYSPHRNSTSSDREPRSPRNTSRERRVIFCDYCFLPNHKWRSCRQRLKDLENRRENTLYENSRNREGSRSRQSSRDRHPRYNSRDRNSSRDRPSRHSSHNDNQDF